MNTTMGDEDLKKFMPAILFKDIKENLFKISKQEDAGTCVVCLCDFEDEEKIRSTYCKHVFHSECLTDWMKKNESCPYCRTALNKENIVEIYDKFQSNSLNWLGSDDLKQNDSQIQIEQQGEATQQINNAKTNIGNQESNQIQIGSRNAQRSVSENQNEISNNQQIIQNSPQTNTEVVRKDSRKSVNQSQRPSIKQSVQIFEENIGRESHQNSIHQKNQEEKDSSPQQNEQNINNQQQDNSLIEPRKVLSTQVNDNSFFEAQASSKRNIDINQARKSQFMNDSEKKSNSHDQSYIHDIKNLNQSQIGQDISMDIKNQGTYTHNMNDEADRMNVVECIQSEHLYYTKENEEKSYPTRKTDNGLQIVFGENIALDKMFKQSPNSSVRQSQILNPKRRGNNKKVSNFNNPQSMNSSINSMIKNEKKID